MTQLILLLDIYPRELKTYFCRKICTLMFIIALFIIARKWKQPKCPSANKWIKKMWCVHTREHFLTMKGNEVLITCYYMVETEKQVKKSDTKKKKKKSDTKGHILYDSVYMNCPEQANP